MSSNLQNWLNCCELPQCWLCIYLHLKTYLAISRRAGWPACSWWERWWVSEWAAARAGSALRGRGTARGCRGPSPGRVGPARRPRCPSPALTQGLPRSGHRRPGGLLIPLRPGAAEEAAPGACPSLARRAPPAPGTAGRARRDGPGRERPREPVAGPGARSGAGAGQRLRWRGGGAAPLPSRPECGTLPPANAARSKGNEAAGAAEFEPGLPRARVAPIVRGSGASWSSRREKTQARRCGGSEGVAVLVIRVLQKTRPLERQLYWIPDACL